MNEKKNSKVYCTFQDAPEHFFAGHPESPSRLNLLRKWLEQPPYPEIQWLNYSPAKEGEILLIHRKQVLDTIRSESKMGPHEFEPAPTYVREGSYGAAAGAVGAALAVSRQILSNGSGHGFAIIRPPGHHAEPLQSMGFCLFNNVAIAAADAVASGLGKAAIVDIDAHHGNGVQSAFRETPQIGYFSTHENDTYPGTGFVVTEQNANDRIINVPLPAFSGNRAFFEVFDKLLDPWIEQFKPDMLFVAAGYDTHFSDPLTTLTMDTTGVFKISKHLVNLAYQFCNGRIMFVLEGGYDHVALKDNIQASLAAMSGHDTYHDHYGKGPNVSPDVGSLIENLKNYYHL